MALIWSPRSAYASRFCGQSRPNLLWRKQGMPPSPDMMLMTTDEEFASCERSDRILGMFLGHDLQQATLRLFVFGIALCAIAAFVSEIVR